MFCFYFGLGIIVIAYSRGCVSEYLEFIIA